MLINISCKNEQKRNVSTSENSKDLDSLDANNELANEQNRERFTVSEFNTDVAEIDNIDRPNQPIFRNLAVDTSKFFGIWAQDAKGPHADFWLTEKSFFVVDYDGNGEMPYILNKNEITIFYNDFIQKGIITANNIDTLTIKWEGSEKVTTYVKFE